MNVQIKIAESDYNIIQSKLFPETDSREQFGFGLAGLQRTFNAYTLLLRHFIYAEADCLECQSGAHVRPKKEFVAYIWYIAQNSQCCVIDWHTHPFAAQNVRFSGIDDAGDELSFPIAVECLGKGPHASIVLGRESIDARWYDCDSNLFLPVESVFIVGSSLRQITPTGAAC